MLIVLPGAANSASDATTRLYNVPEAQMASDYKEVKNVFMYSVPQATVISRDKPVRSMADLKGMKILTPGAAFAPIIGAWGASPVPMDLNDMFNALSTGVVDATALTPTALLPPWRLSEISKYVAVGLSGLFNPCGAIMNKDSYAGLSPTQKAAFDKLTGKVLALRAAKIFDDWADAGIPAGAGRQAGGAHPALTGSAQDDVRYRQARGRQDHRRHREGRQSRMRARPTLAMNK